MEGVDEEKAQEARNEAATEDTLNAALDVAEKIPVAAGYAKAAKLVNKATGGALTKGASKVVTKGLKQSPMGDQIQGAMNNASESGLTSAVSSAANMSGGSGGAKGGGLAQAGGAAKAAKGSSSPLNGMGSIGGMGGGLMGNKVKLYVMLYGGIAFFAFIIIMSIFSDPNETTLSLTNQDELTFTSNGTRVCTEE